jgi:hypothetical protein
MEIDLNYNIKIDIAVEFTDKNGKRKTINKRANSLVNGFIDLLSVQMRQTSATTVKDISGASGLTVAANSTNLKSLAAGSDATNIGIVCGTTDTAVSTGDFCLGGLILNGNGSNQLAYESMSYTTPATSGSSRSFTISRNVINNSGADINVSEVGLHASGGAVPYYVLIERTLISFTVTNGTSAIITYTFTISASGAGNWQVRGMSDMLFAMVSNVTNTNGAINISGALATITPGTTTFSISAGSGVVTSGIIVGRGSNAVTISDYALQTPCANGTGANQVQYAALTTTAPATSGTSRQFTVVRVLTGNTNGTVSVTEIGLYSGSICIDRQLNSFSLAVSPATKTITYTITVTV